MFLRLTKKSDLTPTIRAYTFSVDEPLNFIPGQFVMLKQPHAEQKFARAFSIVGTPGTRELTFLMKHFDDGHISGYLASAERGAMIEASLPLGRFTLNPADETRVFIASGTGIAPIISFLKNGAIAQTLFGVRSEADLFWTEHLPPAPDTHITLSQPSPNQTWTGLIGRVTAHLPALIAENKNAAWYVCGNPEMVRDVRALLLAANCEPANIHFEVY